MKSFHEMFVSKTIYFPSDKFVGRIIRSYSSLSVVCAELRYMKLFVQASKLNILYFLSLPG